MSSGTITVHIVMQAHLDPVWLWPLSAGVDEALATAHTTCELLDEHPDFIFTSGEAWRYMQIEQMDPALFTRIKKHIAAGRWEAIGGWWLQPDCNFPSGFAMERQIALGQRYYRERFGGISEIGYNVDSFGHAAALPGLLRVAGQRFYVMMRPQEHEMTLPKRLFRWRGYEDGPEVLTWRLARGYGTGADGVDAEHVRAALTELPPGVTETMCFIGVGDHGGGATVKLIEWVRSNANAYEGCRLVFSSPARFFKAVAGQAGVCPLVTGELQHHAIGCYTVHRPIKTALRRAEHRLRQAEVAAKAWDDAPAAATLEKAWEAVCFNHFHDVLGGTCIPTAYPAMYDQLGGATAQADELLLTGVRREMLKLPNSALQRMVFFNASDEPFDDYIEHEPWTQWRSWQPDWRIVDERGEAIPFQVLPPESLGGNMPRLLFRLQIGPCEQRIVSIERECAAHSAPPAVHAAGDELRSDGGVALSLGGKSMHFPDLKDLPVPYLSLIDDPSDNWTHVIDRYADGPGEAAMWQEAVHAESGPCMGALIQQGKIGANTWLRAEWRIYTGVACVELRLETFWCEERKLLKLVVPLPFAARERRDGIMGGSLVRLNDGKERPIQDWVRALSKVAQRSAL